VTATLEPLNGHADSGVQGPAAVEAPTPDPTTGRSTSISDASDRGTTPLTLTTGAATPSPEASVSAEPTRTAPAKRPAASNRVSPVLSDPLLNLAVDILGDLEKVRIANENRLRQLTRDETDADGEERGFGLTLDHPDVARQAALVRALKCERKAAAEKHRGCCLEHDAELNLAKHLRRHPLGPWVKAQRGVGEKQGARLLAAVGDPYWNTLHDRPRTVSELWSYCGYHVLPVGHGRTGTHSRIADGSQAGGNPDQTRNEPQAAVVGVAATRARGQKANWSATAKMRAYLVAVSCMKTTGPYRDVYEQAREKYADTLHPAECRRCGPAGQPAAAGSPRSAGHQHAMALRVVAKEVLKDLWREAKRLHEGDP
jgi:hypothetical protein